MPTIITRGAASARSFGFGGGGASGPGITTTALLDGTVILNGYGIMVYKTGFGQGAVATASFVVPSGVTKIRAICIGAGGGAEGNSENIRSGQGGGGVEGFLPVTAGETLTLQVGLGGQGRYSSPSGDGGLSQILRSGTMLMSAPGGIHPGSSGSITPSGGQQAYGTNISIGRGGSSGDYGGSNPAAAAISVSLAGATAHGGGSATSDGNGLGLGFGGGGGRMTTDNPSLRVAGGIYGFAGGVGTSSGGYRGLGPVGGWSNDSNTDGSGSGQYSGPGGGSFGGAGGDYYSGGYGAGGLIRIWWASSAGVATWINSGGNYV